MRNDKETFITQRFKTFISLTMVEGFDSGFFFFYKTGDFGCTV